MLISISKFPAVFIALTAQLQQAHGVRLGAKAQVSAASQPKDFLNAAVVPEWQNLMFMLIFMLTNFIFDAARTNLAAVAPAVEASSLEASSVVISLDYDGCGDILGKQFDLAMGADGASELARARGEFYKMINDMTKEHSAATLMVGSNRQSVKFDRDTRRSQMLREGDVMGMVYGYHQHARGKEDLDRSNIDYAKADSEVGFCLKDFAKLAENNFNGKTRSDLRWTFDPLLLPDADYATFSAFSFIKSAFSPSLSFPVSNPRAWKITDDTDPLFDYRNRKEFQYKNNSLQITRKDISDKDAIGNQTKIDLLRLQFKQVSAKTPAGLATDFYFIDDKEKILRAVVEAVETGVLTVPENIRFHAVQYDWYAILYEKGQVSTFCTRVAK